MLVLVLVRQARREPAGPRAALRPKLFDVRFAEILGRPVSLNRNVAGEETIIVAFREHLIAEQRQRMFGRSPFPVAGFAAQSHHASRDWVEPYHEMSCFNWRRSIVRFQLRGLWRDWF